MKTLWLLLLAALIPCVLFAQTGPDTMWTRTLGEETFGDTLYQRAYSIQQTSDGGYIMAGVGYRPRSGSGSDPVGLILKMDASGTVSWWQDYPDCGLGNADFRSIRETSDGGYVAVGHYWWGCNNVWVGGMFLTKTDPVGNLEWTNEFGGSANSVCEVTDGFLIAGACTRSAGISDMCVYKTDLNGNVVWSAQFAHPGESWAYTVGQTQDANYFVAGWGEMANRWDRYFSLVKLTPAGETIWTHDYPDPEMGHALQCFSAVETANGGFMLAGWDHTIYGNEPHAMLVDEGGNLVWRQTWDTGAFGGEANSIQELPNGDFVLAIEDYISSPVSNLLLMRISSSGATIWAHNYGTNYGSGTPYISTRSADITSDGGYITAGSIQSGTMMDVYIVKIQPDPLNLPQLGSLSGNVTPATSGLSLNLLDTDGALVASASTDVNGHYAFADLNPGSYYVDLVPPPGYGVIQNHVSAAVAAGGAATVDFVLTALPGTIEGQVTPAYYGIMIDLLDESSTLLSSVLTDASGHYGITGIPAGSYSVELVEPLGFVVNQNHVSAMLIGGDIVVVNFELSTLPTVNDARVKGYWKHQVNANLTGHGNTDYPGEQLTGFGEAIFNNFYLSPVQPITVNGVTAIGNPPSALSLADMGDMLNIMQGGSSDYERACSDYLALLLNVVSGKLAQYATASDDGATVSQAIIYIYSLLGTNGPLAREIAITLNSATSVAAGVIPLDTPNIMFGNGANFEPPYPEPFNPTTTFSFELFHAMDVRLAVYDILGRTVATLINDKLAVGHHNVTFDGTSLPSGMYFAHIRAGSYVKTYKMMLLK